MTDIHDYLSTRLEKSVGDPECWKAAEAALEKSLKQAHIEYDVDQGGSVIYGLKIDLKIKDALSHEWQFSTIQFDFILSDQFDLTFIGEDGQLHRLYMIHHALLGS